VVDLPAYGSAREDGMRIRLAPGPDGTLFVSIPRKGGSVLASFDAAGDPRPGWPIVIEDSTWCDLVLPVADGSVRAVCTLENPDGLEWDAVAAFAFDANGDLLTGWPVATEGYFSTGRVIGTDLTMFTTRSRGDVETAPYTESRLLTIAADGAVTSGTPIGDIDSGGWQIGPDGVAYGVAFGEAVHIASLDHAGKQSGWPVSLAGVPSVPALGPDGRIVLTVGSPARSTTRVVALDRDGDGVQERSAAIPIISVDESYADTGGCSPSPQPPLVAEDGTIYIYSEADSAVVAVDPSLEAKRGWPYQPATPLVLRDERYVKEDAYCPYLAAPAVGPDSTLLMPLQARDPSVGGSIVALGPDGRVRAGWPVGLKRPGSEFWSVVVGSDGTAYVLAIEPESSRSSSASVLAIAPDSTVRYTTTIIDP
jgi:hypothetical protein